MEPSGAPVRKPLPDKPLGEKLGDKGIRTPDLTGAIRALYQLSYIPALPYYSPEQRLLDSFP